MKEYRNTTTGEIHNIVDIKNNNPNTSFTAVIGIATITGLGYEEVFESTKPTPSAQFKIVVRDGVEQVDGKWTQKWVEQDMFSDIKDDDGNVTKTKSQQETELQTKLDTRKKESVRGEREPLLAEADWQIHKIEDADGDTSAWRTYRQQLRDITKASDIYNVTWPTKP
tara:strand:+ start:434 stop:937 length:504 start_codon:yes stop_codon:yes gene_type:complete